MTNSLEYYYDHPEEFMDENGSLEEFEDNENWERKQKLMRKKLKNDKRRKYRHSK
jgi:hypothetical protein